MKRDPSLHIGYSSLKVVLNSLGLDNPTLLAQRIMEAATPYSIKDRYMVVGDSEVRKKATKLIAASVTVGATVETVNRLITGIRLASGHRGANPVKDTERGQWVLLKEVTQIINEFSAAHGLDKHLGAKLFIELGLKLMKHNYGLGKFKYYRNAINELYVAADMVHNDPTPELTEQVFNIWGKLMRTYSSFVPPIHKPEQMVYMVYARMEADAAEANYKDWLTAQFDFFSIFDSVPSLPQLVTDKALQRYYEYMAKKGSSKSVIKNDRTDYKTAFEQKYFEAYRAKLGD